MPPNIKRCPVCKAFQGFFRRRIPGSEVVLALFVTLLAVLSGFLPQVYSAWNYRSVTKVHVLGAKQTQVTPQHEFVILVQAFNSGGRPALIRSVDVEFEGLPIEKVTDIAIDNPEHMLLLPDKPVVLRLVVKGFVSTLGRDATVAASKVLDKKGNFPQVRAVVKVDETERDGDVLSVTRDDKCSATRFTEVFERYVPKNAPEPETMATK
jgi:hypothetical protein